MRRFATIILSLCLSLSLTGAHYLLAQDEPKKDETPKPEASKPETSKPEAAKTEPAQEKEKEATPKPDASASTEPPIPPEVEAKLEAARRAVAEAIVAAQDAGLVKTTHRPTADPRHPGHRPRQRRKHAQGPHGRQPRGLRRLVHRLRHHQGHQPPEGCPDHSAPTPA